MRLDVFLRRLRASILLALAIPMLAARSVCAADLSLPPTDFLILSPDGARTIGHANYRLDKAENGVVLRGVNRYDDGSTDLETDHIWYSSVDGAPLLAEFEHYFYNADSTPMLAARADTRSGIASCIAYKGGETSNATELLDFPPDTWAGASIMIPMQIFGRESDIGAHTVHVFTCAPGPKIFTVTLSIASMTERWPEYQGVSADYEVTPRLGIFDFVIRPLIPRLHAWFDPRRGWDFVGAQMTRYYRGPQIIIAKAPPGAAFTPTQPATPAATPTPARAN